jgi:hypothetical protein
MKEEIGEKGVGEVVPMRNDRKGGNCGEGSREKGEGGIGKVGHWTDGGSGGG